MFNDIHQGINKKLSLIWQIKFYNGERKETEIQCVSLSDSFVSLTALHLMLVQRMGPFTARCTLTDIMAQSPTA